MQEALTGDSQDLDGLDADRLDPDDSLELDSLVPADSLGTNRLESADSLDLDNLDSLDTTVAARQLRRFLISADPIFWGVTFRVTIWACIRRGSMHS
jgi:hypothetical protein